ncbi:MAG TPA: hydroxyethylthiazole kinase [Bacillota bacterium]
MGPLSLPPFGDLLEALRRRRPLIHHLTNMVVAHVTANVTLALGASPIMAAAAEEVEEVAARADALVLNLGTLSPAVVEVMIAAGRAANAAGRPVILDPVGYGFTRLRTQSADRILAEIRVAVIRGNQAEIALLAGSEGRVRGVDAAGSPDDTAVEQAARRLAERTGAVVAATGPVDRVAGAEGIIRIDHGHPLLTAVTGTGCMATTAVAAFAASAPDLPWAAAAAGLGAFALAGERAAGADGCAGPGTFQAALLDALYRLQPGDLNQLRVEVTP